MGEQGKSGMPPPGRTLDGRRRGEGGFINKLHNNKRQILGPEWSLSDVGTLPPHDSDIPHRLVTSNTHTHTSCTKKNLLWRFNELIV